MNDSQLIWEAYHKKYIPEPEVLEESVMSTVAEIYNDIRRRGGISNVNKDDLVYYLGLIKRRSERVYREIVKKVRAYIEDGVKENQDRITQTIIMIIMNIVAFGISVGAVSVLHKTGMADKAINYGMQNKQQVLDFVDEVVNAVDSVGQKVFPQK